MSDTKSAKVYSTQFPDKEPQIFYTDSIRNKLIKLAKTLENECTFLFEVNDR
jgi:hypothetical protein